MNMDTMGKGIGVNMMGKAVGPGGFPLGYTGSMYPQVAKGVKAFPTLGQFRKGNAGYGKGGKFQPRGLQAKGIAPGILGACTNFGTAKPSNPLESEKNKQVMDSMLPMLAQKIDENGGVMRITDLGELRDIKDQLAQIPNGFPKALPKIMSQWPQFFVCMPNGLVGTTMGYDTGMIKDDGTLNPAFESMFLTSGSLCAKPEEEVEAVHKEPVDLADAADDLWRAALNLEDDNGMYNAFAKVQVARSQVRGEGSLLDGLASKIDPKLSKTEKKKRNEDIAAGKIPAPKPEDNDNNGMSLAERQLRRERIHKRTIEKLMQTPQQSLMLSALVADSVIMELKRGAINKFLAFLDRKSVV